MLRRNPPGPIGSSDPREAHVEAALKENLVALCDIDQQRLDAAVKLATQHNSRVKAFADYRKMFDDAHREFDVVFVATADHHHAPASMMAIKHGKHTYTEKPLTHSIYEARRLAEEARKAGVATQLGGNGVLYVGERGTMLDHRILPEEKMKQIKPPEKTIPRVPGHHEDFFIACRGGRPACSNFQFAGNLTEAALVGNVAIRAGRRIDWDAEAMSPRNCSDPEVLRVIRREYRKGWTL